MKMKSLLAGVALSMAFVSGAAAQDPLIICAHQASFGSHSINCYDKSTGVLTESYTGIAGNGRGVVIVGDVIYYTVVSDPRIYMIDKNTKAALGSILTSVASMSTIGWDGEQFWTSDYTGANSAYRINTTGTTTKTVALASAGNYYDGLEYFNGKLIANRFDGGYGGLNTYDVYDTDGLLLTPAFITQNNGTGIAFDGTNFYVSDVFGARFGVYDGGTGAFIKFVNYSDGFTDVEDLSFDYAQRTDTGGGDPPSTVPEPSTMVLLATGLVGLAARRRWRREG